MYDGGHFVGSDPVFLVYFRESDPVNSTKIHNINTYYTLREFRNILFAGNAQFHACVVNAGINCILYGAGFFFTQNA